MTRPTLEALQEHVDFVRNLAQRLVADPGAAEDVVQETWLAALERPPRHARNLRGWLGKLVARSEGRRRRTAGRRLGREERAARGEEQETPADVLERREALRRVTEAVLALDEPYLSTVLQRFYEGEDAATIARRTGTPVATVRSRLQRALAHLRARLDRDYGGDRRAWSLGLLALVAPPRSATVAGALAKACIAFLLLAGSGVLAWRWVHPGPEASSVALDAQTAVLQERGGAGPELPRLERPAAVDPRQPVEASSRETEPLLGGLEIRVVRERDGRPAAEEEVRVLLWEHPATDRLRRLRTDQDGRASLEGLSPGPVVIGTAHGAQGSSDVVAGEVAQFELRIPLGFSARGRVVNARGEAVAKAHLWLSEYFDRSNGFVVGESGPDGSFEVRDVPEARYLAAFAEGYAPSEVHYLPDLQAADEGLEDVELEVVLGPPGGGLRVDVVDGRGAPVPQALVRVGGRCPRRLSWTDEQGSVRFGGLPGLVEIDVLATGFGVWRGRSPTEATTDSLLRVDLAHEAVVRGTVLGPDARGVEGSTVRLAEEYDPLRPSCRVDVRGCFELRGLPAGPNELMARHAELGSDRVWLELDAGGSSEHDFRLESGRVVRGQAVGPTGEPLVGWWVKTARDSGQSLSVDARTDELGRFRLVGCPDGPFVVLLYRDVLKETFPTCSWGLGSEEDEVRFAVEESELCDASLRGTFLGPDGEPVGGHLMLWSSAGSSGHGFEADSRGVVLVEHLRPGTYDLAFWTADGPRTSLGSVEVGTRGHDLGTVRFEPPGRLRLLVSGKPAEECAAYGRFRIATVSAAGELRDVVGFHRKEAAGHAELAAGEYVLFADANPGTADERVPFSLAAGEEHWLDLLPRQGKIVRFRVRVPDGRFPASMRLEVMNDREEVVVTGQFQHAADGRISVVRANLPPGAYSAEVETPDGRRAIEPFAVLAPGGTPPLEVVVVSLP